jgi:hypothetical protein
MNLTIEINGVLKHLLVLKIVGTVVEPFKQLRHRELEVLAWLHYYHLQNQAVPAEHRDKITFHKDTRDKIAEAMKISMDSLYNILMALKKFGLIEGSGDNMKFVEKYIVPFSKEVENITLAFK